MTISGNRHFNISAAKAGCLMALLALVASFFIGDNIIDGYGICMACHDRDSINWLVNMTFDSSYFVAPSFKVLPALTGIGVLVGAALTSLKVKEFKWHRAHNPLRMLVSGILVMNFALIAAGCAMHIFLKAAMMDSLSLLVLVFFVTGILFATYTLKCWALR